jgi:SulP family sulfate permease
VPDIEYTALTQLSEFQTSLQNSGTALCLAALNPRAFQVVSRAPLGETLGQSHMFYNLEQAVEVYVASGPNGD